jgi:hypothetical protein
MENKMHVAPEDVAAFDYAEKIVALVNAVLAHPDHDKADAAFSLIIMGWSLALDASADSKTSIAHVMIEKARELCPDYDGSVKWH